MTGADLAICRRFSAALAALDCDAALADAHPEIELHLPREILHGAGGLRALLAPPPLDYLERTIVIDGVIDAGERAVALARIQLRWRDTDQAADTQHVGAVLEVREGGVIRWRAFPDPDAALAAAAATLADTPAPVARRDAGAACQAAGPRAPTAPHGNDDWAAIDRTTRHGPSRPGGGRAVGDDASLPLRAAIFDSDDIQPIDPRRAGTT